MDDLVRSYFNIYGCKVIQENFESIGEKRYNIIQEDDFIDSIIEESLLEEGYELDEGAIEDIKNKIRPHINRYAVQRGLHKAPGWVKGDKRWQAVTKPVLKDVTKRAISKLAPKPKEDNRIVQKGLSSIGRSHTANPEQHEKEKKERENRPKNPRYSTANVTVRIKESVENVREIIKKGSKEAGSKEKDLSRGQVGELHKKTQAEIRKSLQKEDLDDVLFYLYDNGFASSYESAMNIMESMSDVWFESILDEKYVASMDPGGKGSDRRAKGGKRLKPMPDRYKYSEAGFDRRASRTSPSTRKRKEKRRGSEGGFNA